MITRQAVGLVGLRKQPPQECPIFGTSLGTPQYYDIPVFGPGYRDT
ncbi:hypothetical protein SAMN06265222_101243 [Neorhodopirellula lusitana]|uniref:Uncharacterized protein n=1 Tax=Neorhodopirellula lusitana TaxID=445327 RepID=A0ABY1PSP2_9BACT|nr:hypothetical protein SAMN06265222_101243 [Neorhodopirellula lusitana]